MECITASNSPCSTCVRGRGLLWLVAISFVASQFFSYFGTEVILYGVVITAGSVYLFRRSGDAIWVAFFLLAITSLLYPVSANELGEPGVGAFRPYNVAIASMAAALLLTMWRRRREARDVTRKAETSPAKWMIALAGVFCLATLYGDLSPSKAGAVNVLQQSSEWASFFLFVWIGYKLSLSRAEVQSSFTKLHWAAVVYCIVFLVKFGYLAREYGFAEATDFGYSQRIMLYFAGVIFVFLIARRLAPEGGQFGKAEWFSAFIFVPAVVLSGSRGVVGALILTLSAFAAVWRVRALLRLTPLLLALLVISVVVLRSHSEIVQEYLVARFLVAPDQDPSYLGRVSEMEAVAEAVRYHPVLGQGMLATYMFLNPMYGWTETAYVDNGVGYLLMKTGLLGTSVFVVLVLSYLKVLRHLRRYLAADALVPLVVFVFYLAFLPFGVSFFDPRYSWLVGILCGYSLYLTKVYSGKTSLQAMEM
jgi:O-antigen ligase